MNDPVKDQKGYEHRPMDWQEKLIINACIITVIALLCIAAWGRFDLPAWGA